MEAHLRGLCPAGHAPGATAGDGAILPTRRKPDQLSRCRTLPRDALDHFPDAGKKVAGSYLKASMIARPVMDDIMDAMSDDERLTANATAVNAFFHGLRSAKKRPMSPGAQRIYEAAVERARIEMDYGEQGDEFDAFGHPLRF